MLPINSVSALKCLFVEFFLWRRKEPRSSLGNIIWCHDSDCCQGNFWVSSFLRSLRALSSLLLIWIVPFFPTYLAQKGLFSLHMFNILLGKDLLLLFLNCQCCLHQAECTGSLRVLSLLHTSEIIMLLNSNSSKVFLLLLSCPLTPWPQALATHTLLWTA